MQITSSYILAITTLSTQTILPVAAQYFKDDDWSLAARAFYDGFDLDKTSVLDIRDDSWLETGYDAARVAVPYAAGHINLPEVKHNLVLGVAGKVLSAAPTLEQIAASKAHQEQPSAQARYIAHKAAIEAAEKAKKAETQKNLDKMRNIGKESRASMNRDMAKARERSPHPVGDQLKSNTVKKTTKKRDLYRRWLDEELLQDEDSWY